MPWRITNLETLISWNSGGFSQEIIPPIKIVVVELHILGYLYPVIHGHVAAVQQRIVLVYGVDHSLVPGNVGQH